METTGLAGKTALVTGASRGIGRACAVRLARAGASVAVNFVAREEQARETLRLVEAAGGRGMIVRANVADSEEVDQMVREVNAVLGPVELLVNNAGVFDYVPHEQTTLSLWRRTLEINLTGTYLVTWAVKDQMLERGYGRIVNMASISALEPRPMSIAYAASKAAVVGLTKSVAAALAAHNVRVNAVAPGLIETEILEGVSAEALEAIVKATPLGRIGQPDDVAETVYYLLSDQSHFVTGQTLVVCGGRVMRP
jgi:3-oxoacyl-[acyl-carrier protein] reductase